MDMPTSNQPPERSDKTLCKASSANLAIAELTACLALVRPVGMSPDEARDWLTVAAQEVMHFPPRILSAACLSARRSCTHHAQIVPHIVAEADAEWQRQARLDEYAPRHIIALPSAKYEPEALPPITQADVDRMSPDLIRIGLGCGALVQDENGNVRPTQ